MFVNPLNENWPRILFAPDFRASANIGKRVTEIHVNSEQQPELPLERIEKPGAQLDWRVVPGYYISRLQREEVS